MATIDQLQIPESTELTALKDEVLTSVTLDTTWMQDIIRKHLPRVVGLSTITDDDQQLEAELLRNELVADKRNIMDTFEPGASFFNRLHKRWTGERAKWSEPMDIMIQKVQGLLTQRIRAKQIEQEENQRRIERQQKEAAAEAQRKAAENARLTEEARLAALDPWDNDPGPDPNPPQAVFVPAPILAPAAPLTMATKLAKRPMKPKMVNFGLLVVSAAINYLRASNFTVTVRDCHGNEVFAPRAEDDPKLIRYLLPNNDELKDQVKKSGEMIKMLVPGVEAEQDISLRSPRRA